MESAYFIMDQDLSQPIYATYLGNGADKVKCVVVDDSGTAYLSGITFSPSFPTTPGCFDNIFDSGRQAIGGLAIGRMEWARSVLANLIPWDSAGIPVGSAFRVMIDSVGSATADSRKD